MKKTIILIMFIILFYYLISIYIKKNDIKIPDESIRIRVIANSNIESDQNVKKIISNNLMTYLNNKLKDSKNIGEARGILSNSLSDVNLIIDKTLEMNDVKQEFKLNYGYNYFPQKTFKNSIYKEGYYESLLVTLGNGLGDNFWCLLFPPLCLLDDENVEYTSFISELLNL